MQPNSVQPRPDEDPVQVNSPGQHLLEEYDAFLERFDGSLIDVDADISFVNDEELGDLMVITMDMGGHTVVLRKPAIIDDEAETPAPDPSELPFAFEVSVIGKNLQPDWSVRVNNDGTPEASSRHGYDPDFILEEAGRVLSQLS